MPTIIDQAGIQYPGETIRLDGNLYARLAADATVVLGSRSLTGADSTLNLDAIAGTLNASKLYGDANLDDLFINGTATFVSAVNFEGSLAVGSLNVKNDPASDLHPTVGLRGDTGHVVFGEGGSVAVDTHLGRLSAGNVGGVSGTLLHADRFGTYPVGDFGRYAASGSWALSQIFSAAASFQSSTVPFVVVGTDRVDNLTAHHLGTATKDDAYFQNADNLNAGHVPYARLPNAGGTWDAGGGTVDLTGAFRTSMPLTARVATTATAALIARTTTHATAPVVITGGGVYEAGDGTAARDCFWERSAAGIMQLTNTRLQVRQASGTTAAFSATTGGANADFLFFVNGNQEWGRSGAARDTRMRSPAAGELTIDTPSGGAARLSIGGAGSWGSGVGAAVFLLNTTTAPSGNPTGGGILYVEAGALKYRGTSGTVTTLGNA